MEDEKVVLQLTVSEANLILAALSELPFKMTFELIQKITQQAQQQVAAAGSQSEKDGEAPAESAKPNHMSVVPK